MLAWMLAGICLIATIVMGCIGLPQYVHGARHLMWGPAIMGGVVFTTMLVAHVFILMNVESIHVFQMIKIITTPALAACVGWLAIAVLDGYARERFSLRLTLITSVAGVAGIFQYGFVTGWV